MESDKTPMQYREEFLARRKLQRPKRRAFQDIRELRNLRKKEELRELLYGTVERPEI